MNTVKGTKINRLIQAWPEGTVKTSVELAALGVSNSLTQRYIKDGWLVSVGRGAFARAYGKVSRLGALLGLQYAKKPTVHAGGRTALELLGYSHYAAMDDRGFFLFGPPKYKLPGWFRTLFQNQDIVFCASSTLPYSLAASFTQYDAGAFTVTISAPERAVLELLYHVPTLVGFDEALQLVGSMGTLRHGVMQELLERCTNIKVKRLFLYMARESGHRWYKELNREAVDLGSGKRVVVKNGKLDKEFQLTVPNSSEGGLF